MSQSSTGGKRTGAMDPLDAFMASIDSDIVQQATPGDIREKKHPCSTRIVASSPGDTLPAPAQLATASKVAHSPFFDLLQRRRVDTMGDGSNSYDRGEGSNRITEAREASLRLLQSQPAEFLRRYGHILSPTDLDAFAPSSDPEVALHLKRLQILKSKQLHTVNDGDNVGRRPSPAYEPTLVLSSMHRGVDGDGTYFANVSRRHTCNVVGARIRNRRYKRLQQLAEGGVWFSDEAMKERDPWLWYECVGRRAGEEAPAPKDVSEQVPGNTTVRAYLRESLAFMSKSQVESWPTEATSGGRGAGVGMAFLSAYTTEEEGENQGGRATQGVATACESTSREPRPLEGDHAEKEEHEMKPGPGNIREGSDEARYTPSDALSRSNSDTDTVGVTAAVEACRIQDGQKEGDRSNSRSDGVGSERHVRFSGIMDVPDDEGVDREEEDDMEEGREEIVRILWERFLAGEEEGVDYADVDGDERLDDLDQIARDEQDQWFGDQDDDL